MIAPSHWNPQVLQQSSVATIAPFLDPGRDVITSLEQTRHRLIALNCLAPGASTLITNLLRCTGGAPRRCVGLGGEVWVWVRWKGLGGLLMLVGHRCKFVAFGGGCCGRE